MSERPKPPRDTLRSSGFTPGHPPTVQRLSPAPCGASSPMPLTLRRREFALRFEQCLLGRHRVTSLCDLCISFHGGPCPGGVPPSDELMAIHREPACVTTVFFA